MVTISEIAKIAGVSISTVSKALNGYMEISDKTKKRVEEVAKKLGYNHSLYGNSMPRKRSNMIGVIYDLEDGFKNLFFSSLMDSFNKNMQEKGYDILLLSKNTNAKIDYLKHCQSKNIEAVLVLSPYKSYELLDTLISSEISVVTIDPPKKMLNSIYSDSYQAIQKSCKYLYELGHRNIAFINGSYTTFIGKERLQSYLDFISEKNLEEIYLKDISNESYTLAEGYNTMKSLFENFGLPDAVCCVSDLMAIGAIQYLNNHGYNVPDDVSIIGFDNLDLCEMVTPNLTSIDQDVQSIGKIASNKIIDMLYKNDFSNEPTILETSIIVRDSCKKKLNR